MDISAILEIINGLLPAIIATTGVTALLKGYVAKGYVAAVREADKAPKWVTRLLALLVAFAAAVLSGDESQLPVITAGGLAAAGSMFLAWLQSRIAKGPQG